MAENSDQDAPNGAEKNIGGKLDREAAADYLGITVDGIRKMQQRGTLLGEQVGTKDKWFFTIDELNKHRHPNGEKAVLETSNRMLHTANTHIERMYSLSTDPTDKLFRMLRRDKKIDRKRIEVLEGRLAEMLTTFEKAISRQHERETARLESEARNKRLDKAADRFLAFTPLITGWLGKKIGIEDQGKFEAVGAFLEDFTPDEIYAMVSQLPQEKQLVLMGLYQEFKKRKDAAAASSSEKPAEEKPTEEKPAESSSASTTETKTT